MQLNKEAYRHEPDHLIYDRKHELDAANVTVKVTEKKKGLLKRGQVLDFTDGAYQVHAENGTPSAILAVDAELEETDEEITASVYISGTFRKSACIAGAELTEADVEALRSRGIYLK